MLISLNLFSQRNVINVDSIIKTDNYNVIKNLKYGSLLRWINLNKIDNINLNNCSHLCDIKLGQNFLEN